MKRRDAYLNSLVRDQLAGKPRARYLGIIGDYLSEKLSILMVFVALYAGAKHHDTINRIEDFVLRHNVEVEEQFFADPRGVSISLRTNNNGKREVYLRHSDSGTEIPILEDLMPPNSQLMTTLEDRLCNEPGYRNLCDCLHSYTTSYKR